MRHRLPFVVMVLVLGACARTDTMHGEISQMTPSVCVADRCFARGNGTELFRGYEVGDCVYLRYQPVVEDGRGGPDLIATEVRPAPCDGVSRAR